LATPTIVKQKQRICPSRYTAFGFPIPYQSSELLPGCFITKTCANHASGKNPRLNLRQLGIFVSRRNLGIPFSPDVKLGATSCA
jgi:hypothetical protein